jgi:hypothetical protein
VSSSHACNTHSHDHCHLSSRRWWCFRLRTGSKEWIFWCPGAPNSRVYVHPITDFLPFQNDSTIRSWIDLQLWSIVLAVSATFSFPWLRPSISILIPFASARPCHRLLLEREANRSTANVPRNLVHHILPGELPVFNLTRSRLACIAVKLAVRLVTEKVLLFVVDDVRLSEHHIEDANVHRRSQRLPSEMVRDRSSPLLYRDCAARC